MWLRVTEKEEIFCVVKRFGKSLNLLTCLQKKGLSPQPTFWVFSCKSLVRTCFWSRFHLLCFTTSCKATTTANLLILEIFLAESFVHVCAPTSIICAAPLPITQNMRMGRRCPWPIIFGNFSTEVVCARLCFNFYPPFPLFPNKGDLEPLPPHLLISGISPLESCFYIVCALSLFAPSEGEGSCWIKVSQVLHFGNCPSRLVCAYRYNACGCAAFVDKERGLGNLENILKLHTISWTIREWIWKMRNEAWRS
jgi:hypothetical protein